MDIADPLQLLARINRPLLLIVLIVALFVLGGVLQRSMRSANDAAQAIDPTRKLRGMLELEFAPDEDTAARVVRDWGSRGRMLAAYSVGLDALFIVLYVAALILGARLAAEGFASLGWGALAVVAVLCGWAGVLAGVLDVFENWALIRMLDGRAGWPHVTSLCARTKFCLAIAAGIFLTGSLAMLWLRPLFVGAKG